MSFKINADKYAFSEAPQPEKVDENYNAVLIRKLISSEAEQRQALAASLEQSVLNEVRARTDADDELRQQISLKADKTEVEELQQIKADKTEVQALNYQVDTLEQTKVEKTELEALDAKAEDLETGLSTAHSRLTEVGYDIFQLQQTKADKTEVEELQQNKADKTEVEELQQIKADKTEVQSLEQNKADKLALNNKEDKTFITYASIPPNGVYYFPIKQRHNTDYRCLDIPSLEVSFDDGEYPHDYISGLSFDCLHTPTQVTYSATGIINWVGTDCTMTDGLSVFQPSANTHYDIVFYYSGMQFIGLVNGYVPSVSR